MSDSSGAGAAVSLKDKGNALFKAADYKGAIRAYSEAIAAEPSNFLLFSNRSAANLKLDNTDGALADADTCISLNPSFQKGHFRRGLALEASARLEEALAAFNAALDLSGAADVEAKVKALKRNIKLTQKEARQADKWQQDSSEAALEPEPSHWAQGLSPAQQAEWFTDCYRMRVDDDYALGGCNLHGLYDLDGDKGTICHDFLSFCKLAAAHGVVPPGWSWARALAAAERLLPYAFEKSDAHDKYGRENVFAAMMGGRSLRFTAQLVYAHGAAYGEQAPEPGSSTAAVEQQLAPWVGRWRELERQEQLFGDVGGAKLWRQLHANMHTPQHLGGFS